LDASGFLQEIHLGETCFGTRLLTARKGQLLSCE
jgi:hypothetical protein